jgi:hypothetical protein
MSQQMQFSELRTFLKQKPAQSTPQTELSKNNLDLRNMLEDSY